MGDGVGGAGEGDALGDGDVGLGEGGGGLGDGDALGDDDVGLGEGGGGGMGTPGMTVTNSGGLRSTKHSTAIHPATVMTLADGVVQFVFSQHCLCYSTK